MKIISNSPSKSHQKVTTFSHMGLAWHCADNAEIKDYIILPIPEQSSFPHIVFLGKTYLAEIKSEVIKKNVTETLFLRLSHSILLVISFKHL